MSSPAGLSNGLLLREATPADLPRAAALLAERGDAAYEGRGLVCALMGWAHERSRDRGHLLQVMIGIPYFYRQFGYEYIQPMPAWRELTTPPASTAGTAVRRATLEDLPQLRGLQDRAQLGTDLRMAHSEPCWRSTTTTQPSGCSPTHRPATARPSPSRTGRAHHRS
ncbi:MAG: hypothetical protein WD638_08570 [Nitriliruptoraceae bacterium]